MLSPKDEIHKDLTRIIENNTKEAEEIKVSFFALNGSELEGNRNKETTSSTK
jgi:hypothetical protein